MSVETLREDIFPAGEPPLSNHRTGCVGSQFEVSLHVGAKHGSAHRLGKQDHTTKEMTEGDEWVKIPRLEYKAVHWEAERLHLESRGDNDGVLARAQSRAQPGAHPA